MTDTTAIAAATPLQITIYPQQPVAGAANSNTNNHGAPDNPDFWGQGGFSFKSFLDTVNPLQHIPVVSTLYQSMTGDVPSSGSNIAGGILFGGPIGLATSLINEIAKTQTGNDIGGNLLALLQGNSGTQVAQNIASDGTPYLSANQRAAYNVYVKAMSS